MNHNTRLLAYHEWIEAAVAREAVEMGSTTRSVVCPKCRSSERGSFAVTRVPGAILYKCHRASCGLEGAARDYGYHYEKKVDPPQYPRAKYWEQVETLDPWWTTFFMSHYGVGPYKFWRWHPELKRVAMPIQNREGILRGVSYRSYRGDEPKTLIFPHSDEPMNSFYLGKELSTAVVVEDQVSAWKICSLLDLSTVALMGTGHGAGKMLDIAKAFDDIILYLDADALKVSASIAHDYAPLFNSISIVSTPTDPKDTSVEELKRVLDGAREHNSKLRW